MVSKIRFCFEVVTETAVVLDHHPPSKHNQAHRDDWKLADAMSNVSEIAFRIFETCMQMQRVCLELCPLNVVYVRHNRNRMTRGNRTSIYLLYPSLSLSIYLSSNLYLFSSIKVSQASPQCWSTLLTPATPRVQMLPTPPHPLYRFDIAAVLVRRNNRRRQRPSSIPQIQLLTLATPRVHMPARSYSAYALVADSEPRMGTFLHRRRRQRRSPGIDCFDRWCAGMAQS